MPSWLSKLRDLVVPAALTWCAAAAFLGASTYFERERRAQLEQSVLAVAAESRDAIATKVERHVTAVADLARVWSRFGGAPEAEWTEDTRLLMKNIPGYRSIAWVSLGGAPLRVVRMDGVEDEIDANEARAHADAPAVTGPERLPSGAFGYRLYHPVPKGAADAGVLVASVDVSALLGNVLGASAPGYAIAIDWGEERIAARGQPASDPSLAWWRAEGTVPLASGVVWRITHQPTDALAASLLSPFPTLFRVVAALLSLTLGVIAYQLCVARRRSRALVAVNRELDQGMREAREGEAALRRLSDELEERVRSRTLELESTLADLETFNFSVSHDLRAPIGAALNFLAILEEDHGGELSPAGRELVGRIRGSSERALALLEGLLKLSRASRAALEFERLDMGALAREAFAQVWSGDASDEIGLQIEPLPPAWGDRALIGGVLSNLLSNAVKFTQGCPRRRVVVSGGAIGGRSVYAVEDNGVGFDERHASKLFAAFERLHHPDRFEGAGIGLAIVARIVRRHGGEVWAESKPEQGAKVFFSLPRKAPSS